MSIETGVGFSPERKEYGGNVQIRLKIMRHGERENAFLTDYGRQVTSEKAVAEKAGYKDFDAVKAIGSPAAPNPEVDKQMGRALETVNIYAI